MHGQTMKRSTGYFLDDSWTLLLVDDVPGLQPTISPAHEEDTGSDSTPAAISEQLCARVDADQRAV